MTAWVLGDQLSPANPALEGVDRVLLIESRAQLRRPVHRARLHLYLSAMRHFAQETGKRIEVDLRSASDFRAGLDAHRRDHAPDEVVVCAPASLGARAAVARLGARSVGEGPFLTSPAEFGEWRSGRKRVVMEDFYRWQRKRLGVLVEDGEPAGGSWNYDAHNRERPSPDLRPPKPYRPREDEIDTQVRDDLDALAPESFGADGPRLFPATRAEARRSLRRFVDTRLPHFGRWQDAMLSGERFMWHSLLSTSLNMGLLGPMECVRAAERAYAAGEAPLPAVEGFIRQIIGWREYVAMLHLTSGPGRRGANALSAKRPLPKLLWDGQTDMACLADAVGGLIETGYAHHIERLMLFGNLMLLTGADPAECLAWFRDSFIDGNEWVMDANVLGMATFADGGEVMTKPYAASGRYVQRMSDHCSGCRYDPGARTGEEACPLTTLYWDFLDRNRDELAGNRRMALSYRNLDRIDAAELDRIRARARSLEDSFGAR